MLATVKHATNIVTQVELIVASSRVILTFRKRLKGVLDLNAVLVLLSIRHTHQTERRDI